MIQEFDYLLKSETHDTSSGFIAVTQQQHRALYPQKRCSTYAPHFLPLDRACRRALIGSPGSGDRNTRPSLVEEGPIRCLFRSVSLETSLSDPPQAAATVFSHVALCALF